MRLTKAADVTQAHVDVVLRQKLLTDFLFFTRYFFKRLYGKRFSVAPHHERIALMLQRCAAGEVTRLIINIPPRFGKTELAVKMFLAWILAQNAAAKSIHISYSDDLALDNSSAVRDIVKHDEFQRLFPVVIRSDTDSRKKWYTDKSGGLYAVAAGGAITGFGAGSIDDSSAACGGVIIIDDANKPDDAFSETMRDAVNRRYNNTIASRTNAPDTPIIVIQQRLHEDDLSGYLLSGGSGEEWEHLCIPAINDDGTALWPGKLDIDRLEQMRSADSYTFSGQYMQSPSPVGGGNFKDDWWQYYTIAPHVLYRVIFADTALKTQEFNDYSVFQCWGRTATGVVLLDQIRGKWESPELLKRAIAFWNKHKRGQGTLRCVKIEDKASGTGLIQQLSKSDIPVIAVQRCIDKITRANDASPWIESGHVSIPENAEWVSDYVHEFGAFPNGKHDDQIDPTMDAIADMLQGDEMTLFDFDRVKQSVEAGSGQYMGDDALVCAIYVARSANEASHIVFRRGKDACSEQVYRVGWEKSKDPLKVVALLAKVVDNHKPDMLFIGESGLSGIITDRMHYLGYNCTGVQLAIKADEDMKHHDKLAECMWSLRQWVHSGGSVTESPQLEYQLCSVTYDHDNKDRVRVDNVGDWVKALALTFAHPVPLRELGRNDVALGVRRKSDRDYNPLDGM